jgi:hypothetical protein
VKTLLLVGGIAGAIWYWCFRPRQQRFIDTAVVDPARFLPYPRRGLDPGAELPWPRRGIDPGR